MVLSASKGVSVGTTSTEVLLRNLLRRSATFVNDSDTVIYLSKGEEAKLNAGIRLNALGGSYEVNATNPWDGQVFAISSVAGKVLCVTEDV